MSVIEETTLVYVAARENSNKFYRLQLHSDGTVLKQWGRVGGTGQKQTISGGASRYHATISEKERKGYRRVDAPTSSAALPVADVAAVATTALRADTTDTLVVDLIERIAKRNRHDIEAFSGGRIRATMAGVSTALGPITPESVHRARRLLTQLELAVRQGAPYVALLDDYLTLVPQKVGGKAGWERDFLSTPTKIAAQWSLLDALGSAIVSASPAAQPTFRYSINRLEDPRELKRISALFDATRNDRHSGTRGLRVKAVFVLEDTAERQQAYAQRLAKIGGERRLWHGTPAGNVLSILAGGLVVPRAASHGRMFGNGVYLADQSSKATGYCGTGVWGGGGKDEDHFVFLADVALGRTLRPTSQVEALRACGGSAYDSIVVAEGTCGVHNSETIVWDTDQIGLRYLVELA